MGNDKVFGKERGVREQQKILDLKVRGQCREIFKSLAESLDLMHHDIRKVSFDKFKERDLINSLFREDSFGISGQK